MKTRITPRLVIAAAVLCAPLTRLVSQAPPDIQSTFRVAAGEARGDGGFYRDRRLNSFSVAVDFARHRAGGSGPLAGFGFTYFQATGSPSGPTGIEPLMIVCPPNASCATAPARQRFPDVRLGYIDLGWRWASHDARADVLLQPGVALTGRPDVAPIALGGGASVTRRFFGSVGAEIGVSSSYLPGFYGARVGLSQLTLGLRSW